MAELPGPVDLAERPPRAARAGRGGVGLAQHLVEWNRIVQRRRPQGNADAYHIPDGKNVKGTGYFVRAPGAEPVNTGGS